RSGAVGGFTSGRGERRQLGVALQHRALHLAHPSTEPACGPIAAAVRNRHPYRRRPASVVAADARRRVPRLETFKGRQTKGHTMAIDEAKLTDFLNRFVGDLGATMAAGNIVLGDRLGLYKALTDGPRRPQEVAARTGTAPRYVDEWLRGQAAGGYVEYDPETGGYRLTEEQAFALTNPDGPVFVPGAFQLALAALRSEPRIAAAFRSGAGVGWHTHDAEVFDG